MNNKLLRNAVLSLVGTTLAMMVMAAPLTASASALPQATVTVKEYDMDEYLNMLWKTEQYDRYEKFAAIANQEAWDKHLANRDALWEDSNPVAVVIANADWFGFNVDKDIFSLVSLGDEVAKVKVKHGHRTFIVTLTSDDAENWEIKTVNRI